jgi:phenylalanyl-tRNA synthetase beta chain
MTISDRARELMIGQGFQEVMTYILTNRETLCEKMNDDARPLEMDNVMSESYSAVRSSLVPILLEIESKNSDTEYPHRFFETGEVAVRAPGHPEGTATCYRLAAITAHSTANFSELNTALQAFMYYAGVSYSLEKKEHPSYIPGRAGAIMVEGRNCGIIGEIHPAVLANWGITVPCTAFEFDVEEVFRALLSA